VGGEPRHPRREAWLGLVLVLLTFARLSEARWWRPGDWVSARENVQVAEAKAWWNGRLDLPDREWDTALKDGRVYSHFPPMFSFLAALLFPVFGGVPHVFLLLAIVLPVPVLAYVFFRRQTESSVWGALLAISLVCGTSVFPVLDTTLRRSNPYFVNQTLALVGLLILLIELHGRRRVWLAGVGLVLAALSRQLTIAYWVPLAFMAHRLGAKRLRPSSLVFLGITTAIVVGVPTVLNTLKFGSPFDSGYLYVYNDRAEDDFSRDARTHGVFSPHYVGRNLYYANLGFPVVQRIEVAGRPERRLRPNDMGTGIWWTTPLLLWLFVDLRRLVVDAHARPLLIAAGLVAGALLFYHSTGWLQRGYNRYSLDYVPVLLALIAPRSFVGWRKWLSLPAILWSVVYFRWLI